MSEIFYHEITINGYFPQIKKDLIGSYSDSPGKLRFGKLIFRGTDDELTDFYDKEIGYANTYFKVIGVKSFKSEGYDTFDKVILNSKTNLQII